MNENTKLTKDEQQLMVIALVVIYNSSDDDQRRWLEMINNGENWHDIYGKPQLGFQSLVRIALAVALGTTRAEEIVNVPVVSSEGADDLIAFKAIINHMKRGGSVSEAMEWYENQPLPDNVDDILCALDELEPFRQLLSAKRAAGEFFEKDYRVKPRTTKRETAHQIVLNPSRFTAPVVDDEDLNRIKEFLDYKPQTVNNKTEGGNKRGKVNNDMPKEPSQIKAAIKVLRDAKDPRVEAFLKARDDAMNNRRPMVPDKVPMKDSKPDWDLNLSFSNIRAYVEMSVLLGVLAGDVNYESDHIIERAVCIVAIVADSEEVNGELVLGKNAKRIIKLSRDFNVNGITLPLDIHRGKTNGDIQFSVTPEGLVIEWSDERYSARLGTSPILIERKNIDKLLELHELVFGAPDTEIESDPVTGPGNEGGYISTETSPDTMCSVGDKLKHNGEYDLLVLTLPEASNSVKAIKGITRL